MLIFFCLEEHSVLTFFVFYNRGKDTKQKELKSSLRYKKAQNFFETPTDILRYLWFKHTGFFQIIEPKTIVKRHAENNRHWATPLNEIDKPAVQKRAELKLKYNRKMGLIAANWLNNLTIEPEKMGEMMHPKRAMWVRFIRALRLASSRSIALRLV